jgi:hypothetical protein
MCDDKQNLLHLVKKGMWKTKEMSKNNTKRKAFTEDRNIKGCLAQVLLLLLFLN